MGRGYPKDQHSAVRRIHGFFFSVVGGVGNTLLILGRVRQGTKVTQLVLLVILCMCVYGLCDFHLMVVRLPLCLRQGFKYQPQCSVLTGYVAVLILRYRFTPLYRHYSKFTPISADYCYVSVFIPFFGRCMPAMADSSALAPKLFLKKLTVVTPGSCYVSFGTSATVTPFLLPHLTLCAWFVFCVIRQPWVRGSVCNAYKGR